MMISQPALICLNATWQSLTGWTTPSAASATEQPLPESAPADVIEGEVDALSEALLVTTAVGEDKNFAAEGRDQAPALHPRVDPSTPLAANERRARAAALRAMALSRERRFDAAGTAFAEAARLDPALDLTRTPAFWTLERAAHEAAIKAYARAGRDGDAAVLRARVHSTFRPKPLRTRQQVVLSR